MKSKKFETKVLIVCILIIAITIGLELIFNENRKEENKNNEQNISLLI